MVLLPQDEVQIRRGLAPFHTFTRPQNVTLRIRRRWRRIKTRNQSTIPDKYYRLLWREQLRPLRSSTTPQPSVFYMSCRGESLAKHRRATFFSQRVTAACFYVGKSRQTGVRPVFQAPYICYCQHKEVVELNSALTHPAFRPVIILLFKCIYFT